MANLGKEDNPELQAGIGCILAMWYRKTLFFNTLGLPSYWADCRKAREEMKVETEKVFFGKNRRQYALCLKGVASREDKFAFYFHGGAWTFGEPATFTPAAIPWLDRGYTVVLPSYRRPPAVGLNRIIQDCRAAIAAVTPGVEVTDLHVGGISAGAHLAAVMALHPEWWQAAGWSQGPNRALLCAGPLKLDDLWPASLFKRYEHLNPWRILSEESPQIEWQLLHGTADATVAYEHALKFQEKLSGLGQSVNLLTIPNGTHLDSGRWMFDGFGAAEVSAFIE